MQHIYYTHSTFERAPKAGTMHDNAPVGGTADPFDVSAADHMIAEQLAPFLVEHTVIIAIGSLTFCFIEKINSATLYIVGLKFCALCR
jgi:hypothetical protein